jgi:hypothetical protein
VRVLPPIGIIIYIGNYYLPEEPLEGGINAAPSSREERALLRNSEKSVP